MRSLDRVSGDLLFIKCQALTSLNGGPKLVDGKMKIVNCNALTSLEGGPDRVGGRVLIRNCDSLKSLDGFPSIVDGNITINATGLNSLVGLPNIVGHVNVGAGNLYGLKGCPKHIHGNFSCSQNFIGDFINGPEIVDGDFYVPDNILTSLNGFPKKIGGSVWLWNNSREFTKEEVREVCDVGGHVYV